MGKIIVSLIICAVCLAGSVFAVSGVECRLTVYQYDQAEGREVVIYDDTSRFAQGIPASGFAGPLSVEINVTSADSAKAGFNVHLVTLGPVVGTYSKSFVVEYSLPARIDDIAGKNGARYAMVVQPQALVGFDTAGCFLNHRAEEVFASSPSAYMDLYYVGATLADFHWESVREYLDFEYRRFQEFAGFTLPGKLMVYLCPCPIPSVIWDDRFATAIDPTRNITFSLYSKAVNTADPFIVTYPTLLRNFGYTAPFVCEGLANYFSLSGHMMKQILKDNPDLPLRDYLDTYRYFKADPTTADRVSASFVRYLVDTWQFDRIMLLYREADDLNLTDKIEEVYGLSIDSLEAGWKHYVDTLTISSSEYHASAALAEQMLNYRGMTVYAEECLKAAASSNDSLRALNLLRRSHFFNGDYYKAAEIQRRLIDADSSDATAWMARGSYEMMNGLYPEALADFQQALALDSTNHMVNLNLALYYINQEQPARAKEILENNFGTGKEARAQGETRIFLADLLKNSDDAAQRDLAKRYYQEAIAGYEQTLNIRRASASQYMWLGAALLGLDDVEAAIGYLAMAEFLETRPFYMGMIHLLTGKAYLQSGRNDLAEEHFAEVLAVASADYHQRQAKAYLEQL